MKTTLIRTNKQNRQTVKTLAAEDCLTNLSDERYALEVSNLRDFVRYAEPSDSYPNLYRLPYVCPSAAMRQDDGGALVMTQFNGLLTLSVNGLHDTEEAARMKQLVAVLPSTRLACLGSSGRTLKVVVAVSRPDGTLPQREDDAERFCRQAFPIVVSLYEALVRTQPLGDVPTVVPAFRRDDGSMLHAGFRMTYDNAPFCRPDATPLSIADGLGQGVAGSALSDDLHAAARTPQSGSAADSSADNTVGRETRGLIDLLEQRYAFRMNNVMGYVEYRSKDYWYRGWQPVDERMQNSMAMEARLAGLNVWDKDVIRFLKSGMVQQYNPVWEYLWSLHGKWDGKDYIEQVAKSVPTSNSQWPQWFRTWFLGMVAQWLGKDRRYGNSIAPLLISRQGYNKSTFCKSLLPAELQWGYNDNLVLSEKKSVLQAMSQFLLINLDEFNQISPKMQEGFLKNLIQLASVKIKRPYGKHVEDFPRLASFIATANVTDILADPSGNRRFIGIELTGPIDVNLRINHTQLYAQAVALLERDEPYWLDEEQTRKVMESNRQFQLRSSEEMYFAECFEPADSEDDGQWLTTTAIFSHIRQRAGAALKGGNLMKFGRVLSNIDGLATRRGRRGTEYLVKLLG